MKDKTFTIPLIGGIDERQPALKNSVEYLQNWITEPISNGWTNTIGYDRYMLWWSSDWSPFSTAKVDSLYYFNRHGGNLDSIIIESNGVLSQLYDFDSIPKLRTISDNRSIPNPTSIGTQFRQFGKFLYFCNGDDRAGKIKAHVTTGRATTDTIIVYPFGFQRVPSTPIAWKVQVDPTINTSIDGQASLWVDRDIDYGKGLGSNTVDDSNTYYWKVSFITNTGCESPLSEASPLVRWTTTTEGMRYIIPVEIPLGDNDVVARRLYRTTNNGEIYYFVAQINNNTEKLYYDFKSDERLGAQAPSALESVLMPAQKCRFIGTYKSCIVVDGGVDDDTTLFFSNPSRPDQFSSLDFIQIGNKEGGSITGLHNYFNFLLVFRERAIEIFRGDYPNFVSTRLASSIGTTAVNTITSIQGVGIIFLSYDGVYVISGNLEYGASPSVEKISLPIQRLIEDMNVSCIAKATAEYSHKNKEWMCFFPSNGSIANNIGIVFHIDKQQWSVRKGFPVGQLIVNKGGDFIFGNNVDASGTEPRGLFVFSKRRALGQYIDNDVFVDDVAPTSIIRSNWLDFGDSTFKKKVHYVYLLIATGGSQSVQMKYYTDYQYNTPTTTTATKLQPSERLDQSVYDAIKLDDNLYWEESVYTAIRFDIHSTACGHFQWEIETDEDMTIIGYMVDFTSNGQRIIQGKRI